MLRELCAGTAPTRLLARPYLRERDDLDDAVVRGNTDAPTIMVAERAADLLRDRVAVPFSAALPAPV